MIPYLAFLTLYVISLIFDLRFIDDATGALFVLVQVYNPSYNIFARLETATIFTHHGKIHNEVNFKRGYLVMNLQKQYKPVQQITLSWMLVIFMSLELLLWIYELYEGKKK
jgi:hypothetical protein